MVSSTHFLMLLSLIDIVDAVGSSAVRVLKDLVQLSSSLQSSAVDSVVPVQRPTEIVESLAVQLDEVRHPRAKACVYWLVGQYAGTGVTDGSPIPGMAKWAPDVLRRAVKSFTQEASSTLCSGAIMLNWHRPL
jgi:AP-3 complex subunit beta